VEDIFGPKDQEGKPTPHFSLLHYSINLNPAVRHQIRRSVLCFCICLQLANHLSLLHGLRHLCRDLTDYMSTSELKIKGEGDEMEALKNKVTSPQLSRLCPYGSLN